MAAGQSEELRKKGNVAYAQGCSVDLAPVVRRTRLLTASKLYKQALHASRNEDARAKCCKNLGAAHWKYATSCMDASTGGKGFSDRPLTFDIEASLEWYVASLRHGRLSRQSEAWLQNIHNTMEDICKTVTEGSAWLLDKPAFVRNVSALFQAEVTSSGRSSALGIFQLGVARHAFDGAVREFQRRDSNGGRDFKQCLSLLHSCYTPIQEAERTAAGATAVLKQVQALKSSIEAHKATCESLQAIATGKRLLEESANAADGAARREVVVSALDQFKEAVILARRGADAEIEAEANANVGDVYVEHLDQDELADPYFSVAVRLAQDSNAMHTTRWYQKAQAGIKKFFRKKKERNDRTTKEIERLRAESQMLSTENFLKYVYTEHPPRGPHAKSLPGQMNKVSETRRALRHAVHHYHPDHNYATNDEQWNAVCTEITKLLLDQLKALSLQEGESSD